MDTFSADPHAARRGYLAATDYALPHLSRFSRAFAPEAALLRHANCGYLSTPGLPPTLLALKQHAQSLCRLITLLEPHAHDGAVAVGRPAGNGAGPSAAAEAATPGTTAADLLHAAAHPPAGTGRIVHNPWDWLADLATPYINDDPDHHRPLHDLVNEVQTHHDALGTSFHCPLATHQAQGRAPFQREDAPDQDDATADVVAVPRRPYASHHNLLMHANMCLERLDHEFGATGGLLSLLPAALSTGESRARAPHTTTPSPYHPAAVLDPELVAARNSLIGQWITFSQQLVGRMHELEIAYGNALDALGGEAVMALALRDLPAGDGDGAAAAAAPTKPVRKGRGRRVAPAALAAPPPSLASIADFAVQDRWILTNAGDDVWSFVHALLDREGAVEDLRAAAWLAQGVISHRATAADRLLYVDLTTRYYRVTGTNGDGNGESTGTQSAHGPIFICPAWDKHPGIQPAAADRENGPTVVMVPYAAAQDGAISRVSALEKRYTARLHAAAQVAQDKTKVDKQVAQLQQNNLQLQKKLEQQNEQLTAMAQEMLELKMMHATNGTAKKRQRFP